MKQLIRVLGLGLAVGGFSASAHADPVNARQVITSDVDFATDGLSWFLQGPGFVLASDPSQFILTALVQPASCMTSADGCRAGDLVNISGHTGNDVSLGNGTASVHGTNYGDVAFRGSFSFAAQPVTFPNSTADPVVISAPFVFDGRVNGFNDSGQELFSLALTGSGDAARSFFTHFGRPSTAYFYDSEDSTRFNMSSVQESAAVTPEPGSLLLLGSGAAFLWRKRRH